MRYLWTPFGVKRPTSYVLEEVCWIAVAYPWKIMFLSSSVWRKAHIHNNFFSFRSKPVENISCQTSSFFVWCQYKNLYKIKVKEDPTFPMKANRYWPDLLGIDCNSVFIKLRNIFCFLNIFFNPDFNNSHLCS